MSLAGIVFVCKKGKNPRIFCVCKHVTDFLYFWTLPTINLAKTVFIIGKIGKTFLVAFSSVKCEVSKRKLLKDPSHSAELEKRPIYETSSKLSEQFEVRISLERILSRSSLL